MPTKPAWPNDNRPVSPVSRLMLKTARLKIRAVITMLIQNAPKVSGSAARTAAAAMNAIGLYILVDPLGDKAARKEDKRHHQQGEGDRRRIGVRNIDRAETLDHADQQRAENRAVHVAEAAQDNHREGVEHLGP